MFCGLSYFVLVEVPFNLKDLVFFMNELIQKDSKNNSYYFKVERHFITFLYFIVIYDFRVFGCKAN